MKAAIKNNVWFGNYTNDYIENNAHFFENYEFTETLPEPALLKPIWNGTTWTEGATEEEISEANAVQVPTQVPNMNFRLALIDFGIMPSQIDAAIDGMTNQILKEKFQTLWNFSNWLERADQSLIYMATEFGINSDQLDTIFINASNI